MLISDGVLTRFDTVCPEHRVRIIDDDHPLENKSSRQQTGWTRSGGLEATSPTGGYDHLENCSPALSGTKQSHPGQNAANGTNSTKGRCTAPISKVRVEKIEGGLMVAGVVVAANCQVALPAFGFLFILVGAVLTAASYRGPGQDEKPDHYAARVAFTGNSRVLGPACIVVGGLMLASGVGLCLLTRRARRRERRVGFHCPLHGDFYPLSPINGSRQMSKGSSGILSSANGTGLGRPAWSLCWRRVGTTGLPGSGCLEAAGSESPLGVVQNPEDGTSGTTIGGEKNGDRAAPSTSGPPQCPHSTISSTRSSVSSGPPSPCPTPLPFLVTSGSVSSGMVTSAGANLSPDQTFGSIRSLSVSREVASFPLSRTPTPPLGSERLLNSPLVDDISKHVIHLNSSAHPHAAPPAPTSILASIHHPHPATTKTTAVASTSKATAVNNNTARASTSASVVQPETATTSASKSISSVPRKSVSIVLPILQDIRK